MFGEKGVPRNFAKFTGKDLCQSLFFNKVAGAACNFIKKETLAQVFSFEFYEIFKNTFFYRTPLVAASEDHKEFKYNFQVSFFFCFSLGHSNFQYFCIQSKAYAIFPAIYMLHCRFRERLLLPAVMKFRRFR